jgi:hypothetical protein
MRALALCVLVGCATGNAARSQPAPRPQDEYVEPVRLKVGDRAPEVAPGKVTLVVFWATWSYPSKVMDTKLEEIWRARRDRFVLRSMNIDDEHPDLESWKKETGATYPIEWDRDHRLMTRYAPGCEPQSYVVDRAGVIRFVHCGWHDNDEAAVLREIDSLQ